MSDPEIKFWLIIVGIVVVIGSTIWGFLKSIYAGDLQEIKNDIYRTHETLRSIDKTLDSINDYLRSINDL